MSADVILHLPEMSDDQISHDLVWLTEHLMKTQGAETTGGFLGGEFGYGADFENDTFMMHPFCWCDGPECPWCRGCDCPDSATRYYIEGPSEYVEVDFDTWLDAYKPNEPDTRKWERVEERLCDYCTGRVERAANFLHKPSGTRVEWYKYIGRGMEIDLRGDWRTILADCVSSLGQAVTQ